MAKKRPTATVRLERGRLSPVTAWDAELLAQEKPNQEYDLVRRSSRSTPHNGMYWAQLGLIVRATEAFATSDHMHTWVKVKLGYTAPIFGPQGQVVGMAVDSASFDKMDQAAFNVFYEKAARLIADEMGIDLSDVKPGFAG